MQFVFGESYTYIYIGPFFEVPYQLWYGDGLRQSVILMSLAPG